MGFTMTNRALSFWIRLKIHAGSVEPRTIVVR
jgi:hypothetical protein